MTPEQRAEAQRSKAIEKQNEVDHEKESQIIKLLLLGAGESGKSTLFKQFKILYGKGFSEEDRRSKAPVVYNNTITSMKILIDACNMMEIAIEKRELAEEFVEVPDDAVIDEARGEQIKALWADEGIQQAYALRSTFQLPDSAAYFFKRIDDIAASDYLPDVNDVLHTRVRTSGIIVDRYRIEDHDFEMYDVGGQRNERRKWIHIFDNVTAIIFVASLSEYDQVLYESNDENRLIEAVNLFSEIVNSPLFTDTSVILFLNKSDLFEEKIARVDIRQEPSETFPEGLFRDYTGGLDFEAGSQYILNLFLTQNRQPNKQVYHHITCATDTTNIQHVMNDTKAIILQENLQHSGFMAQ